VAGIVDDRQVVVGMDIDEARRHDQPCRIDHRVGAPFR